MANLECIEQQYQGVYQSRSTKKNTSGGPFGGPVDKLNVETSGRVVQADVGAA